MTGCGWTSWSRRSARGPRGSPSFAPGDGLWVKGPLGGRSRAHGELRAEAAGAILVGGGIGIAPLAILRRGSSPTGAFPRGSCSAFATAITRAASRSSSPAARCGWRARTATPGHRGYVTDLLGGAARGRRRRERRRLRLRAAGDAGGGAADVRRARGRRASWRWSRRWPAASAPASAAPCRSPTAATCGSAWTGRWSTASEIETALVAGIGHMMSDDLVRLEICRHPARAPGPQR